jgi:PST family polysaccharide transporter
VSLTERTASGIKWSTGSQVARQAVRVLTLLVLVQLIGPSEFGVMNMAVVITGFVDLFRDMGTSAAVIQRKAPGQRLLSTLFWTNVAIGTVAGLVVFAGAPLVADFYGNDRVDGIVRVLAASFIISALGTVQLALLAKALRFRALAALEMSAVVVSSAAALAAAAGGLGAYSLVMQTLTLSAIMTIGAWVVGRWRPDRTFAFADLRSVAAYSSNLVGFNVVNYFARSADNLLIGRYLGATALGHYSLAYSLLLFPLQMVSRSIGRVTFPVYSKVQDDKPRIARGYLRVVRVVSTLTFPVVFGFFVVAVPAVDVLYGSDWAPAAPVIMILVPVALAQSLATLNGTVYQAVGRTDLQLRIGLLWSVLMVASFAIGLQWGITGVAAAYAITSTVIIGYPLFAIPLGLIGLRLRDLAASAWRPLCAAAGMAAAVGAARLVIPGADETAAGLVALIVLGLASYGALSWAVNRVEILNIAELLGLRRAAPPISAR